MWGKVSIGGSRFERICFFVHDSLGRQKNPGKSISRHCEILEKKIICEIKNFGNYENPTWKMFE